MVLSVPRPVLHQRIERRADEMVQRGLIEEVAAVLAEGHAAHAPGLDAIGVGRRSSTFTASAAARASRRR